MPPFQFKTKPYAHQLDAWNRGKDAPAFGYLLEMGCGKSKVLLDDAAHNFLQEKIDGLLIVAPNGVHRNWMVNEIPTHLCETVMAEKHLWRADENNKQVIAERERFVNPPSLPRRLWIVAMNVEAFATEKGRAFANRFLRAHKTMMVIDESSKIKTPSAKRTRSILYISQLASMRRILTGTPVTQGPLDLYSQFGFLNKGILAFSTFQSFKHYYAYYEVEYLGGGRRYEKMVSYRNLDELKIRIEPYHYRITKDECLDLPPKVYEKVYVEMTADQRELYKAFRELALVEIAKDREISVPNVLAKMLRLQQIIGGFMPETDSETDDFNTPIPGRNTRIDAVLDICEAATGKVIIWARFKPEIKAIAEALRNHFGHDTVGVHTGDTPQDERQKVIETFQQRDSALRFFVGTAASGGMGLTLTAANTMIFYSNDFSLETRAQAEDRAHRIGTTSRVTYFDLEAVGTLDSKIVLALRTKKNIADFIMDDVRKGEWI